MDLCFLFLIISVIHFLQRYSFPSLLLLFVLNSSKLKSFLHEVHSLACLLMFLAHIAAGWQSGQYLIFTRPINSLLQSLFWQIFLTSLMTRDSFAHFLHWEFRPSLLALSMVKSDIYNSAAHLLHLLCPSATPS